MFQDVMILAQTKFKHLMRSVVLLAYLRGYPRNVQPNRSEQSHGQRAEETERVGRFVFDLAGESDGLALEPTVACENELDDPRVARADIDARARWEERGFPTIGNQRCLLLQPVP